MDRGGGARRIGDRGVCVGCAPARVLPTPEGDGAFALAGPGLFRVEAAGPRIRWRVPGAGEHLALDPEGGRLAMLDPGEGELVVLRPEDGGVAARVPGVREGDALVGLAPGGARALLHGAQGFLWTLDLATGERARAPAGDGGDPHALVAFHPDGRRVVRAWPWIVVDDLRTGSEGRALGAASCRRVRALALTPDGSRVAVARTSPGGEDLELHDLEDGRMPWSLSGYRAVHCMAFSPDGALLAVGDNLRGLRVLDAATGALRWERVPPRGSDYWENVQRALAFSPDGSRLAVASAGVRVYDPATGDEGLQAPGAEAHGVAFDPEGHLLALLRIRAEGQWRVRDLDASAERCALPDLRASWVEGVSWHLGPARARLAYRLEGGTLVVRDLSTGDALLRRDGARQATLSPDGTLVACSGTELLEVDGGATAFRLPAFPRPVRAAALDEDGRVAVWTDGEGVLQRWRWEQAGAAPEAVPVRDPLEVDLMGGGVAAGPGELAVRTSGREVVRVEVASGRVLSRHPEIRDLADLRYERGRLRVESYPFDLEVDMATGREERRGRVPRPRPASVSLPSGGRLWVDRFGEVSVTPGAEEPEPRGRKFLGRLWGLPDGPRVLAGRSPGDRAEVVDLASGEPGPELPLPPGHEHGAARDPSGRYLAVASPGRVTLHEVATGEAVGIATLPGPAPEPHPHGPRHGAPLLRPAQTPGELAFSPDGTLLAALCEHHPTRPSGVALFGVPSLREVWYAPYELEDEEEVVGLGSDPGSGALVLLTGLGEALRVRRFARGLGRVATLGRRLPLVRELTFPDRTYAFAPRPGASVLACRPEDTARPGEGGDLRLLDLRGEELYRGEAPAPGAGDALALSADGRTLARLLGRRRIALEDLRDGRRRGELASPDADVTALAFCDRDRRLVSLGSDGILTAWEV